MKSWLKMAAMAAALLVGQSALAAGWHKVGSFQAGGEAKEMGVNRNCEACLIKVVEGSVTINTIVVRGKDAREPVKVEQQIEAGQSREISAGAKGYVTGFRISDAGKGRYDVYVR
jgi:hypothetical protein